MQHRNAQRLGVVWAVGLMGLFASLGSSSVRADDLRWEVGFRGGGGGNRTLSRPFRETAATRDFRDQNGTGQRVTIQLVVLSSPLESPGVLPSRGEIVESGGTGVPTPGRFSWIGVAHPTCPTAFHF